MSALIGGVPTIASALLFSVSLASESKVPEPQPAAVKSTTETQTIPSDEEVYGVLKLDAFSVTAATFKLYLTRAEILKPQLYFDLRLDFGWPSFGRAFVITPGRLPQRAKHVAQTIEVIDRNELRLIPVISPEGSLLSVSGFSLSGRSNSFSANRSGQTAALRGMCALVLRDGVPLNDPFGGWIPWTALPREGLARVECVTGGGAPAWGNGTLGGAIQFLTLPAKGELVIEPVAPTDGGPPDPKLIKQVIYGTTQLALMHGGGDTRSAEFASSQPTVRGVLQILGRLFHTDGFPLVASGQRGPIDLAAWSRNRWLEVRWRQPLGKDQELVATVRGHDESGGNGTPYQQGSSRGTFASVAAAGNRTAGFTWNTLAYVQRGSSASHFSAINPNRTGETPVFDRFAVPTTAWGASWTGVWRHFDASRTNAGADLRYARGETREDFGFTNGAFTRQLFAGGNQSFLGLFVSHDQAITPTLRATIGTRVDAWNETDGHHREVDPLTHAVLLDQRHGADRGLEFSPSLGAVWQPNKHWRWRAHGQHSFRRPTLGERYQTSGSNSVVTAANPELSTGHNTSIEVAAEYSLFRKANSAVLTLEAKAFLNELRDAAGHLTIARGSGEFPLLDTLPAGYLGRKRINLDRARGRGLELSAAWHPSSIFAFDAHLLLNDTRIFHSALAPGLAGKQMPEVPRHTALLKATWRASEAISVMLRVRSIGRQFVDGENTLLLDEAVIGDFGATCILNKHTELYVTAENLTDSSVETSRDVDGLVYIGSPRLVLGGLRLKW